MLVGSIIVLAVIIGFTALALVRHGHSRPPQAPTGSFGALRQTTGQALVAGHRGDPARGA